jgi:DNA polymerase-3 subunit delta
LARKQQDTGVTIETYEALLKEKKFSPLYLFHGEEEFLVEELTRSLLDATLDESARSFNLDIVYGSDVDAKAIVSLAAAYPMMSERRVVIVKEFDKVMSKELLVPYLEIPSPTTCLAVISAKPDFRLKAYKLLRDTGVAVECKQLYDNEIPSWISSRVKKLGKKISPEACQVMQGYVSRSLREIQNEIDKLFIYVGEKQEISVDDVNNVVGMSKQFNIFELQKAIGKKDIGRAVEVMEQMLDAGEYPVAIVAGLAKYMQKIWLAQELRRRQISEFQLAADLGVSPFYVKDYIEAARRYSSDELEKCFDALLQADLTLKSTSSDQKYVMTLLLYEVVQVRNLNVEIR